VPAEELELAISGSLMEIRSKAATSDAARSMPARRRQGRWQRRRDGAGGGDGGTSRCSSAP